MKKITGLLLAFIFIIYLGGIEVYYSVKMSVIKKHSSDMASQCKTPIDNTKRFTFNPNQYSQLDWSERNKEFTFNGRHYDIINIAFYSDEVTLTCFDDSNETDLAQLFDGFMDKMFSHSQSSDTNSNDIAGKICKEYIPNLSVPQLFFFHVITTIHADRVLVNRHALIADVWRPPSLV